MVTMIRETNVISKDLNQKLSEEQSKNVKLAKEIKQCNSEVEDYKKKYQETKDLLEAVKNSPKEIYLGSFTSTAYCIENYPHQCNDGDSTKTADGTSPIPYQTVAVDPNIIPLGSKLKVVTSSGNIYYVVANDTGTGVIGNKIDMVVPTHNEGLQWGRKSVEIWKIE